MLNFNAKSKIIAERGWNATTRRQAEAQGDSFTETMQAINYNSRQLKHKQTAGRFQRKVKPPIFNNFSKQKLSDTSLPKTLEDDECSREELDPDDCLLMKHPSFISNPSAVNGNLKKSRARPASKILEEFINRRSLEGDRGLDDERTETFEPEKVKQRKKANYNKIPKQKTSRQSCTDGIYSTAEKIRSAKTFNPHLKFAKSIKLASRSLGIGSGAIENESWNNEQSHQGKVRSDISISVAPYSQKSSVPRNSYLLSKPYSSDTKYRDVKNTTSDNSKHVNGITVLQEGEEDNLKKLSFTGKKEGTVSNNNDAAICDQSITTKTDNLSRVKTGGSTLQVFKARQPTSQQMPNVELRTRGERTQFQTNYHIERLAEREVKYEHKRKQRREIYALNKVMTQLENERFHQFMQNEDYNN